jgi:hypothetical protein
VRRLRRRRDSNERSPGREAGSTRRRTPRRRAATRLGTAGDAAGELRDPRLLELHVVIGIEVVDADDGFAARAQQVGRRPADAGTGAGDDVQARRGRLDHAVVARSGSVLIRLLPGRVSSTTRTALRSEPLRGANSRSKI